MTDAVLSALIEEFAARRALRAGSFIVTFYGDVILPHGGSVWIGNVIDTCRIVGINESQSRTAISRLVEAGRLSGLRAGRRSFYHLTDAAAAEFQAAAQAIHGPGAVAESDPWTLVRVPADATLTALTTLFDRGFGAVGPTMALKPGDCVAEVRATLGDVDGLVVFVARPPLAASSGLSDLAAESWDLDALATVYTGFEALFGPLAMALDDGQALDGPESLVARLLLVHEFRRIALRDPSLPVSALPRDWPGETARNLFRACYDRLTPAAEKHVHARFVDVGGPVPTLPGYPRIAADSNAA